MLHSAHAAGSDGCRDPSVLPVKDQSRLIEELLRLRLDTILPVAMERADLDMWIILCQEDDPDPVFRTMIPMDCWNPILQMLVFVRESDGRYRRYNISGTDTRDLYERPYIGQIEERQWQALVDLVAQRDPETIGINTGTVAWAAGGLTHNLYLQLVRHLPETYAARLVSAEPAAVHWSATLTDREIDVYAHVMEIAHSIIADCFSRATIIPGVSTIDDLVWHYWQHAVDRGLEIAFRPYFRIIRNESAVPASDTVVRPGDIVHCDVGIKHLRLNTDNQHLVYVLLPGETGAPEGLRLLMAQTNRLQDIFMSEFRLGLTGNEILQTVLSRATDEGIAEPRVYSHSLGLFLHQPGPLIGLPWEQEKALPRGETQLEYNSAFAMELSTSAIVPEWNGQSVTLWMEEPVVFTEAGCRTVIDRQTEFYLV